MMFNECIRLSKPLEFIHFNNFVDKIITATDFIAFTTNFQ